MRRLGFIFVLFFTCVFKYIAQDSLVRQKKIQYGGLQQFGLLIEESGMRSNFTFINGLRYRRIFVGIGADVIVTSRNYYGNSPHSSAAFLDARYYINKKKNFFAKTNAGANFTYGMYSNDFYKYKKNAGIYAAIGLGFKARLGREVFYTFDVNYSFRQTRYDYSYKNWQGQWQTEKYDLRRPAIVVNMGIEIF